MYKVAQELINGLSLGLDYSLVALGFSLVFGTLELIAFAQGGVYMVGAYVGLAAGKTVNGPWWAILPVVVACAGVAGGLLNVLIDRTAYRPIRHARRLTPLLTGIGVYIFLQNGAGLWVSTQPLPFPELLPSNNFTVANVSVSAGQLVIAGIALLIGAATWVFIVKTRAGLGMRAVAERSHTASLMGVEPERTIMLTFLVAGVLSAVAGALIGAYVGQVAPTMGFIISIKAFAAAVIGGIGNIMGAIVGGLIVGLVESFSAGYISGAWSDACIFGVLIVVLVIKPTGLFGMRLPDRA